MTAKLLRRLLWVAGFACLCLPVLDDPPLEARAYLQDVTPTSAVVAVIAAAPTPMRCEVFDEAGQRVALVEGAARRRHALRIEGLRADTGYRYRVADAAGAVRGEGAIRTAPDRDDSPVRFAFLGDSGGQPWWVWMQKAPLLHLPARWGWFGTVPALTGIGERVAAAAPHFVLHLGDVVYPWGWNAHYGSGYFRPFAAAGANAPVYAVLGNHDAMDAGGVQLLANFHLPANELTGDERMFSFAWGPVRVIGLDCNSSFGAGRVEVGHPVHTFLKSELSRCTEPWIVVASHYPMRSASRQRDRADLLLALLPLLEEAGVDLYLSGHDHCYQRFGGPGSSELVTQIVSGGGGKSLYEVHADPRARVLQSQYHWCSAETRAGVLVVRAHGLDGALIDTVEVRLPEGDRLDRVRRFQPARATRIEQLMR